MLITLRFDCGQTQISSKSPKIINTVFHILNMESVESGKNAFLCDMHNFTKKNQKMQKNVCQKMGKIPKKLTISGKYQKTEI